MKTGALGRALEVARRTHEAQQHLHAELTAHRRVLTNRLASLHAALAEAAATPTSNAHEELLFRADYERARRVATVEIEALVTQVEVFDREQLEPATETLREAAVRRRSIEKLIEKRRIEAEQEMTKREQQVIDEFATQSHFRRR